MAAFLKLFHRDPDASGLRMDNNPYMKALVAFVGVVLFCCLACTVCSSAGQCVNKVVWILLDFLTLVLFCNVFRLNTLLNLRSLSLIVSMLLLEGVLMVGVLWLQGHVPGYEYPAQALLWLPYMLAPTAVSVMVGQRLGLLTALCASVLGGALFSEPTLVYIYTVVSFAVGIFSAMLSRRVHKREQVLRAGWLVGIVAFVCIFCLAALQQYVDTRGSMALASVHGGHYFLVALAVELGVTVAVNFVLSVFVGGVEPALERLFSITTPITWLEWADMNHPLLRKLQMAASGTFHHSLVVQRLAEAGAEAVDADVSRAGVCALYHDIGKIGNPQYFAENIRDQANSPHAELTPEASARIITAHVTDGVALAREYGLNRRIVDVIREHHGTSTVYFFYRKALDQYKAEKEKFDEGQIDTCPDEVDASIFSYKGPIPQTRESGIVSLADAVESATRSLANPTEDDIRDMIAGIFKGRILDGSLRDCNLTLGEIEKLKETFFVNIVTMHHNRIAYPKKEQDAAEQLMERRKTAP